MPGLHRRLDRPALSDLTQVRRLGVLRPDGMGDIVLTTGLLRELRRQLPATRITLICQAQWASWMRTCPWVDDVVDVEMTSYGDFREPKRIIELLRFVKRVWPLELEVLVQPGTLYWYVPSRALAWFSGAPVRLCWEDPDSGVDTGGGFHTHNLPYPNSLHETEKCFRMLEAIGLDGDGDARRLDTWWTPKDARRGEEIARVARKGRRKLVALGLAASELRKRWPRQRYLDVIREVGSQQDVAFLALGGADVVDTCRWAGHPRRCIANGALRHYVASRSAPGRNTAKFRARRGVGSCTCRGDSDAGAAVVSSVSAAPPRRQPPHRRTSASTARSNALRRSCQEECPRTAAC